MYLNCDFNNRIVHLTESITDMVSFHADLRSEESSIFGILVPPIHLYRLVPLGGGAVFPSISFINGWRLQFATGSYDILGGNLDAVIISVPNVFIRQLSSSAYAVTSINSITPQSVWTQDKAIELLNRVASTFGLVSASQN